jgi:RimJ/RimL family protein N-acetyltransferase
MMAPPMQPVLSDALVTLRPMMEADREPLFAVACDPLIWEIHPAHNRWERPVFDPFFAEGLASDGGLTVVDTATGAVIGSSRYDIRVCEAGEVEIGWTYLARSFWGGKYNRSMKRLMLTEAFRAGFDTAIFLVGETNLRSRRAMEKIGGVLTDRRQAWDMAGVPIDHLIYAITREDFARGPLVT